MERGWNVDGMWMERGWNVDGTWMERGWNVDGADGTWMEPGWNVDTEICSISSFIEGPMRINLTYHKHMDNKDLRHCHLQHSLLR